MGELTLRGGSGRTVMGELFSPAWDRSGRTLQSRSVIRKDSEKKGVVGVLFVVGGAVGVLSVLVSAVGAGAVSVRWRRSAAVRVGLRHRLARPRS